MNPKDITTSSRRDDRDTLEKPAVALTQSHGKSTRALTTVTLEGIAANGDPGKFGRMFGDLPSLVVDDIALIALAEAMVDEPPNNASGDNPNIPAGFTYLGQFVDHDITLDTTPLSDQMADPTATENFRTPALDLDSLYGQGQGIDPQLYGRKSRPPYGPDNKFLIGRALPSPNEGVDRALPNPFGLFEIPQQSHRPPSHTAPGTERRRTISGSAPYCYMALPMDRALRFCGAPDGAWLGTRDHA